MRESRAWELAELASEPLLCSKAILLQTLTPKRNASRDRRTVTKTARNYAKKIRERNFIIKDPNRPLNHPGFVPRVGQSFLLSPSYMHRHLLPLSVPGCYRSLFTSCSNTAGVCFCICSSVDEQPTEVVLYYIPSTRYHVQGVQMSKSRR